MARVEGSVVESVGLGATRLVARHGADEVVVQVEVVADADAAVHDFWLSIDAAVRLSDIGASVDFDATAVLSNGARVAADRRLAWTSSKPSVFAVDAGGQVLALAEGRGILSVRAPSGQECQREIVVALPRPSGSAVSRLHGGLIENGDLAVYVPPLALDGDRQVWLAPWVPPLLPPGEPLVEFACEVVVAGGGGLLQPIELERSPAALAAGVPSVAKLWTQAPGANGLQLVAHSYWEVGGRSLVQLPSAGRYVLTVDQDLASALADEHAPVLSLAVDDVDPIAFEDFLAGCQLNVPGATPIPHPTAAQLLDAANDLPDSRLELLAEPLGQFEEKSTWKTARLGGPDATPRLPPVVYWSLRGTPRYLVLQYWFLYAASGQPYYALFNGYHLEHEGDLEMAQVVLESVGGQLVPVAATASQHYYGEGRHWRDVTLEGGRPMLHVAEAGHATYFEPGFEGSGDSHGSSWGETGFVAKTAQLFYVADRCATGTRQRRLYQYALRDLSAPTAECRALLAWQGRLGRDGNFASAPTSVSRRGPAGFSIHDEPMRFHRAFLFSTGVSIAACVENGTDRDRRVAQGIRMQDLQDYTATQWQGLVQTRIDEACGESQPQHLADHLSASQQAPASYFSCDDWGVLSITPSSPIDAVVDQELIVRVRWHGNGHQGLPVQFPLSFFTMWAIDLGYFGLTQVMFDGPPLQNGFVVGGTSQAVSATEQDTDVELRFAWVTENGVPSEACGSVDPAEFLASVHLFVRDASGRYLYSTCGTPGCLQGFGPKTGEPLQFIVRVCD